ncbi:MAG: CehA/McbA family metallohydrolase [Deltaproteobacteria bacterium]|nr:CehA/McbA family metallohydrolase [Deltaproteobacteria bacterium]
MRTLRLSAYALVAFAACGGSDSPSIDDFYPTLPPTGGATGAFARAATASDLLTGPAAQGLVGDLVIGNDKARFIVQATGRTIGVVPPGGNLIDAALVNADGSQATEDHFGELSMVYKLGRTCDHQSLEIVRDGSKGGPAVIRAVGVTTANDYVDMKGIPAIPVDGDVDPDVDDHLECATTYVLSPGKDTLEVYWTLFNGTKDHAEGPMGSLADTGGVVDVWGSGRGFEKLGIEALANLSAKSAIDFAVYQGPGVAYGLVPRHAAANVPNAQFAIAGVSIVLFGADSLIDLVDRKNRYLVLDPNQGKTEQMDVVVARDAGGADAHFREVAGQATSDIAGTVTFGGAAPAVARVGVYNDLDGNGAIDDTDTIVSYFDTDATGHYAGKIPTAGNHLVRAEVKDVGRSPVAPAAATVDLSVPAPVKLDYTVLDDETSQPIPARLIVIGDHAAFPDMRVFSDSDRLPGMVASIHAAYGTTTDLGDGADPAFTVPAGATYRVYASRGTEWSVASTKVTATAPQSLTFKLRHTVPTDKYVATEWHVHQVGSPDSNVASDVRVRSAVSAGVEEFAVTDHDYVSDLEPIVEDLKLTDRVRVISGVETTPFAYGHFMAWPMNLDPASPSHGAVDWGRGMPGFSMVPEEIFAAMREKGAQCVQINHPRGKPGIGNFQSFFDRANLQFDYGNRSIFGDFANAEVPNELLRLPGASLWSDTFNTLEVWNGFEMIDSDTDGRREISKLDRVLADWFNFLSMGLVLTPTGSSDTHTVFGDAMGMPRTMVRVSDDSPAALASGAIVDDTMMTLTGARARDIVVTNGPMITVTSANVSAIGSVVTAQSNSVTLHVTVTSPDWAEIDTLEVFANATPPSPAAVTALVPHQCWTSRDPASIAATDPCAKATLAPAPMTVTAVSVGGGFSRWEASLDVTIDAADLATRTGATGTDAWLVFRARGDKAIFPILFDDVVTSTTLPVLVDGTNAGAVDGALRGHGVPATAFTAPVFVDFDGGGYRAPFAP